MNRSGSPNVKTQRTWAKARITVVLIVVNVAWFLLVEGQRGGTPQGFLDAGAMNSFYFMHGQWYRPVSAMFVHAGVAHLLVNMVSLYSLHVIELWMGGAAYLVTYTLAGIAGFLLSAVFTSPSTVTLGASGAIFGVFGVALFLALKGYLPKVVRNQLIAVLILNVVFDVAEPQVSLLGHVGGLIAGMAAAAVFVRQGRRKWTRYAGYGAVVLMVVSLIFAYVS